MAPIVSTWAWDKWGVYKYLLFAPLVARVLHSRPWEDTSNISTMAPDQWWCLHVLLVSALRCLTHTLWGSYSNMLFLTRNRRIVKDGVDFHQIDKEWNWDNFIILQAIVAAVVFYCSSWPWPWGHDNQLLQVWSMKGISLTLLVHVGASEPLFYWLHRSFHGGALYRRYHSLHHSIVVPQSFTAGYATPMEHLALCVVMGLPLALTFLSGCGSLSLVYIYVLGFDFLNCMKHCNVEMMPSGLFEAFPCLRYIICTPTYHTLHHKEKNANFCLFMPLFDALGGTLHEDSWMLHKKNRLVKNEEVPDFIFLAHVVDVVQSLHVPFVFRSFASMPFTTRLFLLPMWPGAFLVMLLMWAYSKTFLYTFYNLRGRLHQTWVVPRYGFHYFLPSVKEGINKQIEMGILRADKMGAKVISLAALNKNESLNGGGTLFVQKHPNLKVRVCHGNTLTAAVILNEIPKDVKEVFLTGATSKLGRAIALYLCRKGVRVLMLTLSTDRFQKIQREVPLDHQQYLVQVTKYQPAQTCKTWIVGKWLSPREQRWAPSGTHFHQFVVPPIFGFRRDCTYGNLAAMRLPADVQGLGHCEYTLDRGVVHACHAGGVVHFLEGWTHHEVGAIDVDRIDVVWEAALRHGLRPVRSEGVNV